MAQFFGWLFSLSYPFKLGYESSVQPSLFFFPSKKFRIFLFFKSQPEWPWSIPCLCFCSLWVFIPSFIKNISLLINHWVMSETLRQLWFEERVTFRKWQGVRHLSVGRHVVKIMTSLWFSFFLFFLQVQIQGNFQRLFIMNKEKSSTTFPK